MDYIHLINKLIVAAVILWLTAVSGTNPAWAIALFAALEWVMRRRKLPEKVSLEEPQVDFTAGIQPVPQIGVVFEVAEDGHAVSIFLVGDDSPPNNSNCSPSKERANVGE